MASLLAIAGPLKGAVFHLQTEEVTLGRQASNHLCVGDPSVSRHHCVIVPRGSGFMIRDLQSNNGTFINGERVEERVLAAGDNIRVGDTVFRFCPRTEFAVEELEAADNGAVVVTGMEQGVEGSADTAIQRLIEATIQDAEFSARAKVFLEIGAALNTECDADALQIELLKLILEVIPAEQCAVVLAQNVSGEPTIRGWDALVGEATVIPVSRTLVSKAITESVATFSDDVRQDLSSVGSLSAKRVHSVVVVPLVAHKEAIGAIYLDSADPTNRLTRQHLELAQIIADFAAGGLERAARLKALKEENRRLLNALRVEHDLVGVSQAMRHIVERIGKIARSEATVLIRGETGTGKELAARAIHQNSSRSGRPFEAINCALLRDALLESELFGHERGSFTGAVAQKKGKLELADGGTVFLDELAELGDAPQAMLLRVLQTREFRRLGGTRTMHADIRIIAATNEDLEEAVRKKTFREDLYYRLNVVSITIPPLRERRQDTPLLADHFLQVYSRKNKRLVTKLSREAMSILVQYDWPGNVRELENAIEHAVVFGATDEILPEDLPDALLGSPTASKVFSTGYHDAVLEAKRNIVRSALARASGSYSEAAKLLGIHVNNLHRLMRDLNMKPTIGESQRLPAKSGAD